MGTQRRYDAYCGLYCGACEIFNATTDEDRERVGRIWDARPEQVHCSGCKTNHLFLHCKNCPIRNCAMGKKVEFCFQCSDYPCAIYDGGKEIVKHLPHLKATVFNQIYIKEHGVEQWLVEQEKKWQCPQCKSSFAWYTEECGNCGMNLFGLKDYENFAVDDLDT